MYQALFFSPLEPKKQKKKITPDLRLGKTGCLALFVISKATFTKKAIKTKFVDKILKLF